MVGSMAISAVGHHFGDITVNSPWLLNGELVPESLCPGFFVEQPQKTPKGWAVQTELPIRLSTSHGEQL